MMTTKIRSSVRRARENRFPTTRARVREACFRASRPARCVVTAPRSDRTVDVVAAAASRHVLARLDEANLCPVDDDIALAVRLYHASIGDFAAFAAPSLSTPRRPQLSRARRRRRPRPRVRTRRRSRRRFRPRRVRLSPRARARLVASLTRALRNERYEKIASVTKTERARFRHSSTPSARARERHAGRGRASDV